MISFCKQRRSDDVGTVVYLTDDAPEGLVNSLSTFRKADKVSEIVMRSELLSSVFTAWACYIIDAIRNGSAIHSVP